MSFVVAVPELVQGAAQDLAGIQNALAEAAASVVGPTTGVVPAAADEVSAAIASMFGNFGQEFQALSSQAQAFHAEFVNLMNAGAGAYLSTEVANAEEALANAVNAPAQALFGGVGSGGAATSAASGGLLGGLLGGSGTSGGALIGSLTGLTANTGIGGVLTSLGSTTGLLGGLTSGATDLGGLLGGLTGGTTGLGGLLGGLTGGTSGLTGLLGGLTGSGGLLGGLNSLGGSLGSLLTGVPGLSGALAGLQNSLTGVVNSLLPGLVNVQIGAGPYFTGLWGPYEALFNNTWSNLQSLGAGWLADPFPFLRQFVANQIGYAQTIGAALQSGNFAPVSAIPGEIAHNFTNVFATLTNTNITSSLVVSSLLPPSLGIQNAVGLPLVFGASVLGPPVAALEAAGSSASAFMAAVQAGNPAGAFAALFDAPAFIADGFLNGQVTFPYALSLSSVTGALGINLSEIADLSVVGNFPLDGLLHPPGYYPVTATLSVLGNAVGPVNVSIGAGTTPFTGLLPFLINYAPQQLAQAIGAPASPPPLLSLPLFTF
ncbi:PE family protein [Mycobacterium sp. 050134]|uniref:PE family protein n=1 Tax=Mycobacterium sp. 050134 TaxID=3096111 RepID=UPI002EDABFEF